MLMLFPLILSAAGSHTLVSPGQDILVLIADDVAFDDVREISTPNLDLLAAQGLTFERAYANPVCSLTRRSLLFGRYWIDTRGPFCSPFDEFTPGSLPSLPKLARSMGYQTGLFGKWHVGSNPSGPHELAPQFHGFDVWRAGVTTNSADPNCGGLGSYFDWRRVDDGVTTQSREYLDAAIRDEFLSWWSSTRGPRFAVVSFQLAHEIFHEPPAEFLPPGTPPATTSRGKYEHMVQALDTLVGQVLSVTGPEDFVVFLGDNGTPQVVAPRPGRAKTTTFERGIHVPFIVRAPFVKPGGRTSSLVHVADVYATLAALAGHPKPVIGNSVSFLPVLLDPARTTRSFVLSGMQLFGRPDHVGGGPEPRWDICLRSDRFKLRVDREGNEKFYDLWNDPEEDMPLDLTDRQYEEPLAWHRSWLARLLKTL